MREDIKEIEKIQEDYLFLKEHKIATMQELTAYKKKSTEAYAALNTVRRKLENQCKASPDNSTFKIQLQITGKELSDKAKSIKICTRIEQRTNLIHQNLSEQRKEKEDERRIRSSGNRGKFAPEDIY